MIDINELRLLVQDYKLAGSPVFVQAANMNEILDRLEAAEKDRSTFLLEMGKLCAQCDALRAKIAEMEQQEPVGWLRLYADGSSSEDFTDLPDVFERQRPLYALPGAQPAPSVPEGWKEGIEAVASMLQKKADDYAEEYGYADMGGLSFGGGMGGEVKMDYYNNLIELIEEVRAMLAPVLKSENVSFIDTSQLDGVVSTEVVHSCPPPSGWLRAIDEALVAAGIGVANADDTYEQAKAKLANLFGFHVDVATDPAVNGGWKLVPVEPTPEMQRAVAELAGYPSFTEKWAAAIAVAPEAKP